jgi:hypothetical protein
MKGLGNLGNKRNTVTVNQDTQVHRTTMYMRNGRSLDGDNSKSSFSFVIKGLLIGSALLGTIFTSGVSTALAATQDNAYLGDTQNYPSTEIVVQDRVQYADEFAIISQIRMSNKMLQAAIKTNQITELVYNKIMESLAALNAKIMLDGSFTKVDDLMPLLKQTGVLLEINLNLSADLSAKRDSAILALHDSQLKARGDQVLIFIDGVQKNYPQKAEIKDGHTLVPMRGIFQSLGAIIDWNEVTRTITATKGDITVKLTLGDSVAYVDGVPVKLAVSADAPKGYTMVPLRFVGEALGNKVEWDAVNRYVLIETVKAVTPSHKPAIVVGNLVPEATTPSGAHKSIDAPYTKAGLNIVYGNHAYGNETQSEYDQSFAIVKKEVDSVKARVKGVSDLPSGWVHYFNGERAPEDWATISDDYVRDIFSAKVEIADLVAKGATLDQLVSLYRSRLACSFLYQRYYPLETKDGSPSSSFDFLARRVSDSYSDSQTSLLVYDLLGIEGAILGEANHADAYVNVGGNWFLTGDVFGNAFKSVDLDKLYATTLVVAQPIHYTITPGVGIVAK